MSLNYVTLSSNILATYNTQKNNLIQDNGNQVPYPAPVGTEWMDDYITHYDNDANNGIFSLNSVIMTSNPELLRFDNYIQACNGDDMMGAKISEYWISQTAFGVPQYDGIISITNDASKIRAPIENYICSLIGNIEYTPYYEHLFSYIENQVKSIIWTVTEQNGASTIAYPVSIS